MYYCALKLYETGIFFIIVFSNTADESSIITTNVIYAQMYCAAAANKLFIGNGQCAMILINCNGIITTGITLPLIKPTR